MRNSMLVRLATLIIVVVIIPMVLLAPAEVAGSEGVADAGTYLPLIMGRAANRPPGMPSNPSPVPGATGVARSPRLSWSGSDPDGDALTYAVSLDSHTPPATIVCADLAAPACQLPALAAETTYYWQVVARDPDGAQTAGPIWSFTTAAGSTAEQFASEVIELVNEERATAGCDPLSAEPRLTAAALGHSQDMAVNDLFSHTGSDGSSPADRVDDQGYNWSWVGENIAAGYTTPAAVVEGWMNSEGHRANILNCAFTETGVGYVYLENDTGEINYHHYWTHVFARPAS